MLRNALHRPPALAESEVRAFDFNEILEGAASAAFHDRRFARMLGIGAGARSANLPEPFSGARGVRVHIPQDVLDRRDLVTSNVSAGGAFVGVTNLGVQTFSSAKYAESVLRPAGATYLPVADGSGDATAPTFGTVTPQWVGEGEERPEVTPPTTELNFTPRVATCYLDVSRRVLKTTGAAPVFAELARALGAAEEKAAIGGAGGLHTPLGVIYADGVPVASLGDNGATLTLGKLLEIADAVLDADAPRGSLGFVTNPSVRQALAIQPEAGDGTAMLWAPPRTDREDGRVASWPAWATSACPSNLTKGTNGDLSAIVFGCWQHLVMVNFGGLDLLVDPYSFAATGTVRIHAATYFDSVVARPDSFAVCLDVVTL